MSATTIEIIKEQIDTNPILLYMKGTPQFPMCGFSARVVHILKELGIDFQHVNILENPDIRQELPKYAKWPTFPQLYVQGELIGGCDIVTEMYQDNELQPILKEASKSAI